MTHVISIMGVLGVSIYNIREDDKVWTLRIIWTFKHPSFIMLCMDYVWIYMAHTSILMGQPLTRMHPYGTGTKPHRNQIRKCPVGIHNILLIFWEKRDSFISLIAHFDYTMLHRFIISEYPGPGVNPHFCSAKKTWSGYHATTGHLPIGRLQQLGHHQVLVSSLVIQFVPQRAPQLRSFWFSTFLPPFFRPKYLGFWW